MGGQMSRIWEGGPVGRVMKTGAAWRGFGRHAASRIWGGCLPFPRGVKWF
jgi:hypothetical protein